MKPIVTSRLTLVPATLEIVTADLHHRDELPRLLGAQLGKHWPPPLITVDVMQCLKETLSKPDGGSGWTMWYVVLNETNTLCALGGFKTPPSDGAAEIYYTVLPGFQRKGIATEIVSTLTAWAFQQRGVTHVFAETLPELIASQRVLERNGFERAPDGGQPGVLRYTRTRTSKVEVRAG